jgi:hypothetical protein
MVQEAILAALKSAVRLRLSGNITCWVVRLGQMEEWHGCRHPHPRKLLPR